MKFDKNVGFPFVKFNTKHKEVSGNSLFHHGGSHSLGTRKALKEFVQEQYDLARICLSTDLALFMGEKVVP